HHNAGALRALFTNDARKLASVDARDGDNALFLKILRKGLGGAEIRYPEGAVTYYQAGSMYAIRFDVLFIDARIPDMGIGQRNDLAVVARVGQNFLITRHGRVE